MEKELPEIPMPEFIDPNHTYREKMIASRISKLFKGSRVWITPLSVRYGDQITAMACPCVNISGSRIELAESFNAYLEDFDGQCLKIRTDSHYCLKVDIADLRDLFPCTQNSE